jgi:glycosyltransferase involved in cell wall biosynthesis
VGAVGAVGAPDRLTVAVLAAQLTARVPGGTGRYTHGLIEGLAATTSSDRDVEVLLPLGRTPDLPVLRGEVPTRRLPAPGPVLARLWERGWPPRLGGVDVVHAPTLLVPPVAPTTGLVVTIHDVVPWTHPHTLTPHGVAFHRRMAARAARTAAVVLTPTHTVAASVREVLGPDVDVRALPPVLPELPAATSVEALRDRFGVRGPYVLFVGTAEPRKGLDVLVPAMAHGGLHDLTLVVVGPSGWGDVEVAGLAAEAGTSDRVVVTGRVDDADLAGLYDGARALAMPSRAEGFGLPVVEAMSRGVPVVTSDDPALVEVGGGATLVTPVGDVDALAVALVRAAGDGADHDRLGRAGREQAATYSTGTTVTALWSLYAEVTTLSTGRGPRGGRG